MVFRSHSGDAPLSRSSKEQSFGFGFSICAMEQSRSCIDRILQLTPSSCFVESSGSPGLMLKFFFLEVEKETKSGFKKKKTTKISQAASFYSFLSAVLGSLGSGSLWRWSFLGEAASAQAVASFGASSQAKAGGAGIRGRREQHGLLAGIALSSVLHHPPLGRCLQKPRCSAGPAGQCL